MTKTRQTPARAIPWQRFARIRAVQALCALDAGDVSLLDGFQAFAADEYEETEGPPPGDVLSVRMLAESLTIGAWHRRDVSDVQVAAHVHNWTPARLGAVERAVLRLAMYELFGEMPTDERQPPKVVIDEAIELVRLLASDEAAAFINGVLDAAYKAIISVPPLHPTP